MGQKSTKRILFLCNSTASRLWRIHPVARYFLSLGYSVEVKDSAGGVNPSLIDHFDIIVLQMIFDKRLIEYIKKKKKKYVFEMDDLITWVPKDHYAKEEIKRHGWTWKTQCYYAIYAADLVTTTNSYLQKYYGILRLFKNKMVVLPNYIDAPTWMKPVRKKQENEIRIGYVGGSSHKDDLKKIVGPLQQILKDNPKAKFITMGTGGYSSESDKFIEYNHGKDIFSSLPASQREHYLGAKMMVYPDRLALLDLDIGVAPVVKNRFTKSKTPIKWMEYAIHQTPSVCEKFLYSSIIHHGENGFLATTEEEYYTYLTQLVEDENLRARIGERAMQDVMNNYVFQQHAYKWAQAYKPLLE